MSESIAAHSVDWRRWMETIGRETRALREFVGLSQERLGRLAGISQGAISRFEAGTGLATPFLLVVRLHLALARVFATLPAGAVPAGGRRLLELPIWLGTAPGDVTRTDPPSDGTLHELVRILLRLGPAEWAVVLQSVRLLDAQTRREL